MRTQAGAALRSESPTAHVRPKSRPLSSYPGAAFSVPSVYPVLDSLFRASLLMNSAERRGAPESPVPTGKSRVSVRVAWNTHAISREGLWACFGEDEVHSRCGSTRHPSENTLALVRENVRPNTWAPHVPVKVTRETNDHTIMGTRYNRGERSREQRPSCSPQSLLRVHLS